VFQTFDPRRSFDPFGLLARVLSLVLLCGPLLAAAPSVAAQNRGNFDGEWRYWGGDAWSTRYAPLDQINGNNFEDLDARSRTNGADDVCA
jgi:hypothetical protein